MMRDQATALRRDDAGFSLGEMMVVVLIISVLLAIAVPTFLSARERASNRSAQARANTGLKAHKAQLADNVSYDGLTADEVADRLDSMEPSLTFAALPADGAEVKGVVYVRNEPGNILTLVSRSATGTCFWTRDANGSTTYASAPCETPAADLSFDAGGW